MFSMDLKITPVEFAKIAFQASDEAMRRSCTQPFSGHEAGCPNFGHTWCCPPNCPCLAEMKANLGKFNYIHIVMLQMSLPKDYKKNKLRFNKIQAMYDHMGRKLDECLDELHLAIPGSLALFASSCNTCEKEAMSPCTCPEATCRFPGKMKYSMSSHGIDTFSTLKNAGLPIEANPETIVSRIGLFCTAQPVDIPVLENICKEIMNRK